MTEEVIMKLGTDTLRTTAMLAGPMLASALVVGLVVSVFQAVTQINEATLTFIPKMVIVALVLMLMGPWMIEIISQYTVQIFEGIGEMVRIQ